MLFRSSFPFRIYNPVIDNFNYGTLCNIDQDDLVVFGDSSLDFGSLGIKSQFDVDQGTAVSPYEISIPAYSLTNYTILNVDPNGKLILDYDTSMPSTSVTGLTYTIYDGLTVVATGTMGYLNVTNRGRVTILNSLLMPISSMIRTSNYYMRIGITDYQITSLVKNTNDQFYISNYTDGAVAGLNLVVNQMIIENVVG